MLKMWHFNDEKKGFEAQKLFLCVLLINIREAEDAEAHHTNTGKQFDPT